MSVFTEATLQILLMIIPDMIVWAIILVVAFLTALALAKIPGSIAAQMIFIFFFVIADVFGGPFVIIKILMYVATGVSVVLGYFKLGNR